MTKLKHYYRFFGPLHFDFIRGGVDFSVGKVPFWHGFLPKLFVHYRFWPKGDCKRHYLYIAGKKIFKFDLEGGERI